MAQTLAQVGTEFNDVTFLIEGGITPHDVSAIASDLLEIQTNLGAILKHQPFTGVSEIHLQNVHDQLSLEATKVLDLGSDALAPKEINDIQRDLIDIVQGDPTLLAAAGNGFAPVPALLVPPAPFVDNADQTTFLANFTQDSSDYNNEGPQFITANAANFAATGQLSADEIALIAHIQNVYLPDANTFVHGQGGLYTARFDNELGNHSVADTAGHALIDALKTGNLAEAQAAGQVLVQNAADLNGNNVPFGATPPAPTGSGIPATFDSFGQVGTVFNDATVKLIGGVFDNSTVNNSKSIVADLTATHDGLQQVTAAHPELFTGGSLGHIMKIEKILNSEITAVNGAAADPQLAAQIHTDQLEIINIVQHDPTLAALAAPDQGFMPLPAHDAHPAVALAAHHNHDHDWHHYA